MSKRQDSIVRHLTLLTVAICMSLPVSYAQPKSIGATFSFKGISVSYEHGLNQSDSYIDISIHAETSEVFLYRSTLPGISGSFTWNLPICKWLSHNGNTMTFFAGPGIVAGYSKDYRRQPGGFFGLKGRVGVECSFVKNVVISAFLSPVLGSHMEFYSNHVMMRYYKNGIIYSLVPEIGIKYRF